VPETGGVEKPNPTVASCMAAEERRAWPAMPTAVLCGKVDELVSAPSAGELAIEPKERRVGWARCKGDDGTRRYHVENRIMSRSQGTAHRSSLYGLARVYL
jgi:hypothetical protein